MSFNRENVIWQSPDGTWNRGFYTVHEGGFYGDEDEDYDPEWDVDYDYDSFEHVSRGHASSDDARRSWRGANPGGCSYVEDPEQIAKLDAMAASLVERAAKADAEARALGIRVVSWG